MFTGGNLNGDQLVDFYVVSDTEDRLYVANGPSSFTRSIVDPFPYRTQGFGGNVKIADVDGDYDLDVGVATFDIEDESCEEHFREFALLRNDGTGNFTDPYGVPATNIHISVFDHEFVDINGDGCLDLFVGGCGAYKVFINTTLPCQEAPA